MVLWLCDCDSCPFTFLYLPPSLIHYELERKTEMQNTWYKLLMTSIVNKKKLVHFISISEEEEEEKIIWKIESNRMLAFIEPSSTLIRHNYSRNYR